MSAATTRLARRRWIDGRKAMRLIEIRRRSKRLKMKLRERAEIDEVLDRKGTTRPPTLDSIGSFRRTPRPNLPGLLHRINLLFVEIYCLHPPSILLSSSTSASKTIASLSNSPLYKQQSIAFQFSTPTTVIMSDTFQELADVPKEFVRDGMQFVNRCTKRMS